MRYVEYDELNSSDLPPRKKFNLNESDSNQDLEYQDSNNDTIITIKMESRDDHGYAQHTSDVQILDDTGFYTAHFLIQDLMKKANENGIIDSRENKQEIKLIKEQLEKFKELVEEVKQFTVFSYETTAEDVEDSIGDEYWEGDGVLDILNKDPINAYELLQHWTVLMNDVASAKDIRVQAYKLDEHSGNWDTVAIPSIWRVIDGRDLMSKAMLKLPRSFGGTHLGVVKVAGTAATQELKKHLHYPYGYHAHVGEAEKNDPLDVLLYPMYCNTVHSRILGQPRSFLRRTKEAISRGVR
ncbi:MAG: hypothetical protein OXK80_01830 [Bdellovibrionales bacterium]|nr:hypothetical protein [Bdellovibrionales bacterium]